MTDKPTTRTLTARELLTLELIVEGADHDQIAKSVGVDPAAIRQFIEELATKMDAPSPTEAAVKALREGLIGPGTDPFIRRPQT